MSVEVYLDIDEPLTITFLEKGKGANRRQKSFYTLPLSYSGASARGWTRTNNLCLMNNDELLTITSPKSVWFKGNHGNHERASQNTQLLHDCPLAKVEPVPPIQHPSQVLSSRKLVAGAGFEPATSWL